jgi:hypothetical protein
MRRTHCDSVDTADGLHIRSSKALGNHHQYMESHDSIVDAAHLPLGAPMHIDDMDGDMAMCVETIGSAANPLNHVQGSFGKGNLSMRVQADGVVPAHTSMEVRTGGCTLESRISRIGAPRMRADQTDVGVDVMVDSVSANASNLTCGAVEEEHRLDDDGSDGRDFSVEVGLCEVSAIASGRSDETEVLLSDSGRDIATEVFGTEPGRSVWISEEGWDGVAGPGRFGVSGLLDRGGDASGGRIYPGSGGHRAPSPAIRAGSWSLAEVEVVKRCFEGKTAMERVNAAEMRCLLEQLPGRSAGAICCKIHELRRELGVHVHRRWSAAELDAVQGLVGSERAGEGLTPSERDGVLDQLHGRSRNRVCAKANGLRRLLGIRRRIPKDGWS